MARSKCTERPTRQICSSTMMMRKSFPAYELLLTPGHTPGHQCVIVADQGKRAIYLGMQCTALWSSQTVRNLNSTSIMIQNVPRTPDGLCAKSLRNPIRGMSEVTFPRLASPEPPMPSRRSGNRTEFIIGDGLPVVMPHHGKDKILVSHIRPETRLFSAKSDIPARWRQDALIPTPRKYFDRYIRPFRSA